MKQNVASQTIGAEMVSASNGAAFTGAVTVFVTIDGGAQAQGTVGSGAATHKGNGYHSYTPSQAETNGAHIAFTFTGTGAIPVTVQVYTTFPQTGDSFARLGAPAGASVSDDIAANLAAIAVIDGIVDAIVVDTGTDLPALIAALNNLSQADIRTAIGLASANLDTQLADLPTVAEFTARTLPTADYFNASTDTVTLADGGLTAAKIATAALTASKFGSGAIDAAALSTDAVQEIRDAILAGVVTELTADPGANPTLIGALALIYMAVRNQRDTTASTDEIHNDAGTVVFEADVSDDGTVFSRGKFGAP